MSLTGGGGARTLLRYLAAALVLWLPAIAAGADATAALESRLAACLACHGEKGQSSIPEVPSLGGQPEFYLTVQLLLFRDRLRVVDLMNQMMQGFSNDDLRTMAKLISKLPPPPPAAGAADTERLEKAQALAVQNRCNFCHNRDYGGEKNVPRLAGQREDYLIKALREYKSNARRGYDAAMADVLYSLTDQDLLDLAHFLARR